MKYEFYGKSDAGGFLEARSLSEFMTFLFQEVEGDTVSVSRILFGLMVQECLEPKSTLTQLYHVSGLSRLVIVGHEGGKIVKMWDSCVHGMVELDASSLCKCLDEDPLLTGVEERIENETNG